MEKKTNWFSRVLIIILIIFIAALVVGSFILGEPKFSLTNEIILSILLLIILALSEVFDNFIFDAYYKSVQEELFIEIKINFTPASINMYNLYYLLSKIYYYRKANQLHAKMVLIVPELPESYWKDRWFPGISKVISNLQETFAPAIKNNLLEIVTIEITQSDLDMINKEIEKQEKGSGE